MSQPPNTRSSRAASGTKSLDFRRAPFRALAEPDGAHLRQRADRLGETFADGEHAGDRRRADGAEADQQHAELSAGGVDFLRIFHNRELYHQVLPRPAGGAHDAAVSNFQIAGGAAGGGNGGDQTGRSPADGRVRRSAAGRAVAVKTGLTGRAFATDSRADLAAAVEHTAPREGALVEVATAPCAALPLEESTFDVAVVRHTWPDVTAAERLACAGEVRRVLRPGGRCVVIDVAHGKGVLGIAKTGSLNPELHVASGGAVHVLEAAGFRAARVLATREGLVFSEAAKANV